MTKYGLAAALIAIIGVLVFGYAREYVPTDHRLELEGELNLEPIEPLISYIADQYGVSAVDLRIIVDEEDGSRRLFGRYDYRGVSIWVRSESRETGVALIGEAFRRRLFGAADPEISRLGLMILQDAVMLRASCLESLGTPALPISSVGRPCNGL